MNNILTTKCQISFSHPTERINKYILSIIIYRYNALFSLCRHVMIILLNNQHVKLFTLMIWTNVITLLWIAVNNQSMNNILGSFWMLCMLDT